MQFICVPYVCVRALTEAHSAAGMDTEEGKTAATTAAARKRELAYQERKERELFWSKELMWPEWLTNIPADLSDMWLVRPRPEGDRCIVCASNGSTISRRRNGSLLHKFASLLPGGSYATGGMRLCISTTVHAAVFSTTLRLMYD